MWTELFIKILICYVSANAQTHWAINKLFGKGEEILPDTFSNLEPLQWVAETPTFSKRGEVIAPVAYSTVKYKLSFEKLFHHWADIGTLARAISMQVHTNSNYSRISPYLQHMMLTEGNHVSKQIETHLAYLNRTIFRTEEAIRPKRQAVAIISGIIGLGIGLLTKNTARQMGHDQIREIKLHLDGQMSKLTTLLYAVEKRLEEDKIMEHLEHGYLMVLRDFRFQLQAIETAVTNANYGIMTFPLFNEVMFEESIMEVERKVGRDLLTVYHKVKPAEWPISTMRHQGEIVFLLHIPVVPKNAPSVEFELMQLRSSKVMAKRGNVNLDLVPQENTIAVASENNLHVSIKTEDLAFCHKTETKYFCPQIRVIYKRPTTCVAALFFKDMLLVSKLCKFRRSIKTDSTFSLGGNQFQFISQENFALKQKCIDAVTWQTTEKMDTIERGVQWMKMKPGCHAETQQALMYTIPDLVPIQQALPWNIWNTDELGAITKADFDDLHNALTKIGKTDFTFEDLKDVQIGDLDVYDSISPTKPVVISIMISLISSLLLVLILWVVKRRKKIATHVNRMNLPVYKFWDRHSVVPPMYEEGTPRRSNTPQLDQ